MPGVPIGSARNDPTGSAHSVPAGPTAPNPPERGGRVRRVVAMASYGLATVLLAVSIGFRWAPDDGFMGDPDHTLFESLLHGQPPIYSGRYLITTVAALILGAGAALGHGPTRFGLRRAGAVSAVLGGALGGWYLIRAESVQAGPVVAVVCDAVLLVALAIVPAPRPAPADVRGQLGRVAGIAATILVTLTAVLPWEINLDTHGHQAPATWRLLPVDGASLGRNQLAGWFWWVLVLLLVLLVITQVAAAPAATVARAVVGLGGLALAVFALVALFVAGEGYGNTFWIIEHLLGISDDDGGRSGSGPGELVGVLAGVFAAVAALLPRWHSHAPDNPPLSGMPPTAPSSSAPLLEPTPAGPPAPSFRPAQHGPSTPPAGAGPVEPASLGGGDIRSRGGGRGR